jgi:hypothetical protein
VLLCMHLRQMSEGYEADSDKPSAKLTPESLRKALLEYPQWMTRACKEQPGAYLTPLDSLPKLF